jgi:nucleoside-diphosphate-sugar epimerase
MRKVVITGACGYIGQRLAVRLLKDGIEVWGIGLNEQKMDSLKKHGHFHPILAAFEDYDQIDTKFPVQGFDCFYHLALKGGYGFAKKDYNIQLDNTLGACKAADLAVRLGCEKFVFVGSANEYNTLTKVINPDSPLDLSAVYSICKLSAEMICESICAKAKVGFVTGRLPVAYGPHGPKDTVVHLVLQKLLKQESPDLIEGGCLYDLVYIDDIADGLAEIGRKGVSSRRYYIGHRQLRTFGEIFVDIRDLVAPGIALNFGIYKDSGSLDYSAVDINSLYNDTGFECKADFKDSILKTAEWVRRAM